MLLLLLLRLFFTVFPFKVSCSIPIRAVIFAFLTYFPSCFDPVMLSIWVHIRLLAKHLTFKWTYDGWPQSPSQNESMWGKWCTWITLICGAHGYRPGAKRVTNCSGLHTGAKRGSICVFVEKRVLVRISKDYDKGLTNSSTVASTISLDMHVTLIL